MSARRWRLVIVPKHDEFVQLQVPGEVDRLVADALHQAAVADDDKSAMIDEFVAETRRVEALPDRHADRGRQALAERPRRRFDAGRVAIFGMASRFSSRAGGIV